MDLDFESQEEFLNKLEERFYPKKEEPFLSDDTSVMTQTENSRKIHRKAVNDFYEKGIEWKLKKMRDSAGKASTVDRELSRCTFRPDISQSMKSIKTKNQNDPIMSVKKNNYFSSSTSASSAKNRGGNLSRNSHEKGIDLNNEYSYENPKSKFSEYQMFERSLRNKYKKRNGLNNFSEDYSHRPSISKSSKYENIKSKYLESLEKSDEPQNTNKNLFVENNYIFKPKINKTKRVSGYLKDPVFDRLTKNKFPVGKIGLDKEKKLKATLSSQMKTKDNNLFNNLEDDSDIEENEYFEDHDYDQFAEFGTNLDEIEENLQKREKEIKSEKSNHKNSSTFNNFLQRLEKDKELRKKKKKLLHRAQTPSFRPNFYSKDLRSVASDETSNYNGVRKRSNSTVKSRKKKLNFLERNKMYLEKKRKNDRTREKYYYEDKFSFKPKINPPKNTLELNFSRKMSTHSIGSLYNKKITVYENKKKNRKIKKEEKSKKEIEEFCTFKPKINSNEGKKSRIGSKKKLTDYINYLNSVDTKKQIKLLRKKEILDEKIKQECTFKPKIKSLPTYIKKIAKARKKIKKQTKKKQLTPRKPLWY